MTTSSIFFFVLVLTLLFILCESERSLYDILNINKNAKANEIKAAFKKLAIKYHPDKNPGEDTDKKFQEVRHAYEILMDPEKRRKYDRWGTVENVPQRQPRDFYSFFRAKNYVFSPAFSVSSQYYKEIVETSNRLWIILAYNENPNSRNFITIFNQLANKLKGIVNVGIMNINEEWRLTRVLGLQYAPSVIYSLESSTNQMNPYSYRQSKSLAQLISTACSMYDQKVSVKSIISLSSLKDFQEESIAIPHKMFVVAIFSPNFSSDDELTLSLLLRRIAHEQLGIVEVGIVHEISRNEFDKIREHLKFKLSGDEMGLVYFHRKPIPDSINKVIISPLKPENIVNDIRKELQNSVLRLTNENFDTLCLKKTEKRFNVLCVIVLSGSANIDENIVKSIDASRETIANEVKTDKHIQIAEAVTVNYKNVYKYASTEFAEFFFDQNAPNPQILLLDRTGRRYSILSGDDCKNQKSVFQWLKQSITQPTTMKAVGAFPRFPTSPDFIDIAIDKSKKLISFLFYNIIYLIFGLFGISLFFPQILTTLLPWILSFFTSNPSTTSSTSSSSSNQQQQQSKKQEHKKQESSSDEHDNDNDDDDNDNEDEDDEDDDSSHHQSKKNKNHENSQKKNKNESVNPKNAHHNQQEHNHQHSHQHSHQHNHQHNQHQHHSQSHQHQHSSHSTSNHSKTGSLPSELTVMTPSDCLKYNGALRAVCITSETNRLFAKRVLGHVCDAEEKITSVGFVSFEDIMKCSVEEQEVLQKMTREEKKFSEHTDGDISTRVYLIVLRRGKYAVYDSSLNGFVHDQQHLRGWAVKLTDGTPNIWFLIPEISSDTQEKDTQ